MGNRPVPAPLTLPLLLALSLLFLALAGCSDPPAPPPPPPSPVTQETLTFTTDLGDIIVVLYPEAAPKTVDLMRNYTREGFYVGREFLRVVPGHVVQVADRANGATEGDRRVPVETNASYHFSAGALGIARSADPMSGGPELFIMDFATSHLDGNFTVWGQVVDGMDVVHRIARVEAVNIPSAPAPAPLPVESPFTDRMAVQPVKITATKLGARTVPAAEAGKLPLQVAKNVRVGDHRHSLDAPADLRVDHASDLTWYVRPYTNVPVPSANATRIVADGGELPVTGVATAPGVYGFSWTPRQLGMQELTLEVEGIAWATLRIQVQ